MSVHGFLAQPVEIIDIIIEVVDCLLLFIQAKVFQWMKGVVGLAGRENMHFLGLVNLALTKRNRNKKVHCMM